jgi:predicted RNase H-like HicB family nuclease
VRNKKVKEFNVVIERDTEGYYVASVPALPGCHTQAKSLDKLVERIQEAIELRLEVRHEQIEPLEFIGVQKITVAQSQKGHESPERE